MKPVHLLIDILSYQSTKHMSRLVTMVDESGREKNVFTYSVDCDNVKEISR